MSSAAHLPEPTQAEATEIVLDRIFGENQLRYTLDEGTVLGYADYRVIYLSEDVIRGIYEALLHETGEAWSLILKTAGLTWGRRTAKTLNRQVNEIAPQGLERLSVQSFFSVLESYFQLHGWGHANFDLSMARSAGLIRVTFKNSIFARALRDLAEPVDHMVGGMLVGMFEVMSRRDLDYAEIASPLLGAPQSEFLITAPARIDQIRSMVDDRTPPDEICAFLCR